MRTTATKPPGLERIVTNLQPGQRVVLHGGLIANLFGEELQEAINRLPDEKATQRRYLKDPGGA